MDFSKGTPCQFSFWIAAIFTLFRRAATQKRGKETFIGGPHVNFWGDCNHLCPRTVYGWVRMGNDRHGRMDKHLGQYTEGYGQARTDGQTPRTVYGWVRMGTDGHGWMDKHLGQYTDGYG